MASGISLTTPVSALKKTLHASEQDRHDVARRRIQWRCHQGKVDATRLIFIDETWMKTNMTRQHGRCRVGQRLLAKVPFGRWKTLTFVAGLRCDGIHAPCVFDQPINATSFLAWVEASPGSDFKTSRRGGDGQPQQPQGAGSPARDP